MEFPIYKIVIDMNDPVEGIQAVSLVDHPAIEVPFLCFDTEKELFKADDERHVITGPAILAGVPIYRRSETRGEYYVVFEADTIRQLVEKYSSDGLFNSVNLQHNSHTFVNSAILIESIIIDKERGICPIEFSDVPDGSWIVSYKITDDQLWNEIKTSGMLNGFSIEILSGLELIEYQINKKYNMSKLFQFAKTILKLAELPTDKGTLIVEHEIEIGIPVFMEVDGEPEPAADGEYTLTDGAVIVVEAGIITEIREIEVENEPEEVIEVIENLEEPEVVEVVEDERDLRIKELEAENDELKARIAELEAQLVEAEDKLKMSVETPITKKTTISKDNKALKYFK